ncbi:MAG: epoxyqueuosine reductase QueH [Candidatus Thermoplasmatota archaeon]|nr:epoxyqueuosine reductase QueH [Candidatus Thermoplasmatota archaeon]
MKVLLQTCCGPCLTGSRIPFEEEGIGITGLWYNPNIHPWTEYDRRLQTLQRYIYLQPMEMIYDEEYPLYGFICGMLDLSKRTDEEKTGMMSEAQRAQRCSYCYRTRLKRTADEALKRGYDGYSSTMLISKHQDHDIIRRIGDEIGAEVGCDFVYMDLRKHWKDSIRLSREKRMYRQPYCGCIFSEQERYAGSDGSS